MNIIYVSVTSIVNYYYPYKEPKTTKVLKNGVKAELEAMEKIEYTDYQKRLEVTIEYGEFSVVLKGVIDFLKDGDKIVIYEKKNYPLFGKCRERVRLQLSLYALMISMSNNIPYEEIELYAVDKENKLKRIRRIEKPKLLDMIYKYAKSRLALNSFLGIG